MQLDFNSELSAEIFIFPTYRRVADIKEVANALLARAPDKRAWTQSNLENPIRVELHKLGFSISKVERELQLFRAAVDEEIHKAEIKDYLFGESS